MAQITVDGVSYESDTLTDNAKAQLASLQFLEVHMSSLQSELAVYQTARIAYINELKANLEVDT